MRALGYPSLPKDAYQQAATDVLRMGFGIRSLIPRPFMYWSSPPDTGGSKPGARRPVIKSLPLDWTNHRHF
jgi:hypothetical protein